MVLAIYFKIARESMKHVIEKTPDLNNFSSSDLSIIIIYIFTKCMNGCSYPRAGAKEGQMSPFTLNDILQ